ncbi:MAG TPA: Stp1/IreP family PP2C-type Ser/Thr phosphatase [Clostridiales bacterium]|jgi:protein phosphatase|nr:Stp1/IreP family PP2C-type Ser/Thr phosphatase [Clostridiales bacterium]
MIAIGASDAGKRRKENQDSFYIDVSHSQGQAICVVCDGMGGARAGNVASDMAIQLFTAELKKRQKPGMNAAYMQAIMHDAVMAANALTYEKSLESRQFAGMGTTIVAACVDGSDVVVMNVGDSRAYKIARQEIRRITNDHSVAEELMRRGELTREQAKDYPAKNYITRAVGTEPEVIPEFYVETLEPDEYLLLCSDGLSNLVEDQEILFEVYQNKEISTCCDRLIALANARGGPDNITVILLKR